MHDSQGQPCMSTIGVSVHLGTVIEGFQLHEENALIFTVHQLTWLQMISTVGNTSVITKSKMSEINIT